MKAAEVVQPIGDRILVKALEKRPTFRGHVMAKVISVGTGSRIGKKIVYPNLKTGEVVVFQVPAGAAVRIGKADYYVVRGDDVLKVDRKALTSSHDKSSAKPYKFSGKFLVNQRAAK